MPFVDTHCHLNFDPLFRDVSGVMERARQVGVTRTVVPAYDLASWPDIRSLGERTDIDVALGLHPWRAEEALDGNALLRAASESDAVAIGEIGLDFKVETPADRQMTVLNVQLDVAAELGLPVILHVRGAFEPLLALLEKRRPPARGVVHAFSRGPELAKRFVDLDLHIAFGGAITRERATRARRAAAVVPEDRLLLETDAPSIGLEGVPPEQVEPRHVVPIAEALAEIRNCSVKEIADRTTANAKELFG
jgi:TatD DNase family protein